MAFRRRKSKKRRYGGRKAKRGSYRKGKRVGYPTLSRGGRRF